ncbi:MAG: cytochrome P450 [Phycisphaerales bacterium]|nr:MAG: cytochrome P450 [Phycisphaerales bacterium]
MTNRWPTWLEDRVPGVLRIKRLPRQLLRRNPFAGGEILPTRVPLFAPGSGRPTLPFPHPWNYREPLQILATYHWNAERETGAARHNRYLDVPGFAPVLVTRDPRVIRAISTETGAKEGQFDRDTLPSTGIARATGPDTLLYANGAEWKHQKKLATPPFARTTLFQPEQFRGFEESFRATVADRLDLLRQKIESDGEPVRLPLESEIKAIMLELLVNNFFGANVSYEEIRERHVPSLERVIDHIVTDTVINRLGLPLQFVPGFRRSITEARKARAVFEELTDIVIATRRAKKGQWCQFRSDAPDDALRSNIRVFLAGALEATTSYASWAIAHLARHPGAQERLYAEVRDVEEFTPEALAQAKYLNQVLDETLRLTPSLYFHPRRATVDTWLATSNGERLFIPKGTHILLDIWHANRHEDHWGVETTGSPADEFAPERWSENVAELRAKHDLLHFGFGHGPRFCPGKSLGQLEVALVVGACIKLLRVEAASPQTEARAGVSTKPHDGVLVDLYLRPRPAQPSPARSTAEQGEKSADRPATSSTAAPTPDQPATPSACPFTGRTESGDSAATAENN